MPFKNGSTTYVSDIVGYSMAAVHNDFEVFIFGSWNAELYLPAHYRHPKIPLLSSRTQKFMCCWLFLVLSFHLNSAFIQNLRRRCRQVMLPEDSRHHRRFTLLLYSFNPFHRPTNTDCPSAPSHPIPTTRLQPATLNVRSASPLGSGCFTDVFNRDIGSVSWKQTKELSSRFLNTMFRVLMTPQGSAYLDVLKHLLRTIWFRKIWARRYLE